MAKKYKYRGKVITKRQADLTVLMFFIKCGLAAFLLWLIICGAASL